jgi:hypothetical protein
MLKSSDFPTLKAAYGTKASKPATAAPKPEPVPEPEYRRIKVFRHPAHGEQRTEGCFMGLHGLSDAAALYWAMVFNCCNSPRIWHLLAQERSLSERVTSVLTGGLNHSISKVAAETMEESAFPEVRAVAKHTHAMMYAYADMRIIAQHGWDFFVAQKRDAFTPF